MLKKQAPRKKRSSFLTPEFLRKQKALLETKLEDCRVFQKRVREEIRLCPPDDRRGDSLEQAFTCGERERAARQMEECKKIIPQAIRALNLINGLLAGEFYGKCIDCKGLIAKRRLAAVPWALRCVRCEGKAEAGRKS